MDLLAFIVGILDAIAWPAAAVTALFVLRKPIAQLVPLLARFRYKGLELEFERRVGEVASEAAVALPEPVATGAAPGDERSRFIKLASSSPRAAVLESWLLVEKAAVGLAKARDLNLRGVPARSPSQALRALRQSSAVDEETEALIDELRQIRNEAVHYPDFLVSSHAASQYVELATQIASRLVGIARGDA